MSGAQEVPVHTTAATGTCDATLDPSTGDVTFSGTFTGLTAPATSASLHGLAATGTIAPVLLSDTGLTASTSGTFSGSGTLSIPQIGGMLAGQTYCEVDDSVFPAGEIRGQLVVATPALGSGTAGLLFVALGGIGSAAARVWPRRKAGLR